MPDLRPTLPLGLRLQHEDAVRQHGDRLLARDVLAGRALRTGRHRGTVPHEWSVLAHLSTRPLA